MAALSMVRLSMVRRSDRLLNLLGKPLAVKLECKALAFLTAQT
jgi:hypothetical protein